MIPTAFMLHLVGNEMQRNAELISIQFKPRSRYGTVSQSSWPPPVGSAGMYMQPNASILEGDRVKASGFFGAALSFEPPQQATATCTTFAPSLYRVSHTIYTSRCFTTDVNLVFGIIFSFS